MGRKAAYTTGNNSTPDALRSRVERIERLKAERDELDAAIKEIYAEEKSAGGNIKALRVAIKERAADKDKLQELRDEVDRIHSVLGDYVTTPLGAASVSNVNAAADPHLKRVMSHLQAVA